MNYGLLIRNITDSDNGIYTCAAEVQSTGALNQRDIEVLVYREYISGFWSTFIDGLFFNGGDDFHGLKLP